MDFSSKKLPIILIIALLGVLILQFVTNDSSGGKFIDPETCEIYIKDSQIGGKQYLDEYDTKCLDFKSLVP